MSNCSDNNEAEKLMEIRRPNKGAAKGATESVCWFLHWAAITADVPLFAAGIGLSWTSPVLPLLKSVSPNNPLGCAIDTVEEAWIVSLTPLGSAIGPLAAGYCADKLGRKKALIALTIPMVVGLLILAGAKQIELYYFARFLFGLGAGSAFAVVPMYVSEISQPHNRGKYGSTMGLLTTLGVMFPFSIGSFISIPIYSIICAVPLIVFLPIFSIFMPESPYYLVVKNQNDQAFNSLKKLRSTTADLGLELSEIKAGVAEEKKNAAGLKDLFTSAAGQKAVLISFGLVVLQPFAGIGAILAYLGSIYAYTGTQIDPVTSTIITGSTQVLSNTLCIFLVERMGRKLLLLICCAVCFLTMTSLGIFFYLKKSMDLTVLSWMPLACIIIYMLVFGFGLGPLPWTVMGEILPSNVKGVASALTSTICFLTSYLTTFIYPLIEKTVGTEFNFWLFALSSLIGFFFVWRILFETKGKTFAEIQQILRKNNK